MSQTLFNQPLNVINVGIEMFSDDMKKQNVPVTQLDWTPPGQGNIQVVTALTTLPLHHWQTKLQLLISWRWNALSSRILC